MFLALVRDVQAIGLLQWSLLVRINVEVALNTFLSHVGPTIATHPLPLALGTLVLAEATLLALVRRKAFSFRTCLWTVLDVVPLAKTQMAKVFWWRRLSRSSGVTSSPEDELRESFCQLSERSSGGIFRVVAVGVFI